MAKNHKQFQKVKDKARERFRSFMIEVTVLKNYKKKKTKEAKRAGRKNAKYMNRSSQKKKYGS